MKRKGWHREPARHSLAARGVRTKRHGLPMKFQSMQPHIASEANEVVLEVRDYYGYKAWLAQIRGLDSRYGFTRVFIRPTEQTRSRSGQTGYKTYIINKPGLYQLGGTKRDDAIFIVYAKPGKGLVRLNIDAERAGRIAEMLDSGVDFEVARVATKPVNQ